MRTNVQFSLKPIDIVVLKKLSEVVNVVPVIAKSDSLTTEERDAFKQRVRLDGEARRYRILTFCIDQGRTFIPQH